MLWNFRSCLERDKCAAAVLKPLWAGSQGQERTLCHIPGLPRHLCSHPGLTEMSLGEEGWDCVPFLLLSPELRVCAAPRCPQVQMGDRKGSHLRDVPVLKAAGSGD